MRPLSMMDAFRIMGPAFLVSVALVDPGNWATAIEAGSKFGYELVWVVVASNLVAILLQTLAARLGIVTGKHLAQVCRESYPPQVCALLWILCEISIVALDLTMLLGTAIGLNLLLGWPLLPCIVMTSMDALLLLLLVPAQGVKKSEALTVGLLAVVVACFLVDLLVSRPPLGSVVSGLLPRLRRDSVYTAVSLLGANVMPHNFYLHSALVSGQAAKAAAAAGGGGGGFGGAAGLDRGEIRALCLYNFLDIGAALGVALVINVAVLLVSAATFHSAGVVVHTLQAAHDLMEQTLSSSIAPAAFGTALLCAGQLSTFTGTIAGQVVLQGFLNIHISTWLRRLITRTAAIIPAAILQYVYGDRGTYKFLLIAQVVLALQLPVTLVPLIKATSSRQLMGPHASSRLLAGAAWAATGLVFLANLMLFVTQLLPEVSSGRGILDKDGPLDAWIDRMAALVYSDPLRAAGLVGLLVAASAFLALQLWMIVTPLRVDAWAALSPVPGWGVPQSDATSPAAAPASQYGSVAAVYGKESGAGTQTSGSPCFGGGDVDSSSSCSSVGRGPQRASHGSAGYMGGQGAVRSTAQHEGPQRSGQQHPWTTFAWTAGAPAAAVAASGVVGASSSPDLFAGGALTHGWVVPRWAIATVIQSGPQPYALGKAATDDSALLPLPWRPRERYQRRLSGFLVSEDDDDGGDSDSGNSSDGEDAPSGAAGLAVRSAAPAGTAETVALVGCGAFLDGVDLAADGAASGFSTGSPSALASKPSISMTSEATATSTPASHAAAATAGTTAQLEPAGVSGRIDNTGGDAKRLRVEVSGAGMAPSPVAAAGPSHPSPVPVEEATSPEAGRQLAAVNRPKHPVARGTRPKFARVLEDFWATFYDAYGQAVRRTREAPGGPSEQQSHLHQEKTKQDGPAQRQRQQQQHVAGIQQAQGQGQEMPGGGRGGGGGGARGGVGLRFSAGGGLDVGGAGSSAAAAPDPSPLSPLLCVHTDGSHLCMGCSQALFGAVQQCLWALEQLAEVGAAIWGSWPLQLVLPPDNQTFPYHRAVLLATRNGDFLALQALCAGTYSSRVDHTRLLASTPLIRGGASPPPLPPSSPLAAVAMRTVEAAGSDATSAAAATAVDVAGSDTTAAAAATAVGMSRRSLPGVADAPPIAQKGASWGAVPSGKQAMNQHQHQQPLSLWQPGAWWSVRGGPGGGTASGGGGGGSESCTSGTSATQAAAAETKGPTCSRPQSVKRAACLSISGTADAGPATDGESAAGSSSVTCHMDKARRLADVCEISAARPAAGFAERVRLGVPSPPPMMPAQPTPPPGVAAPTVSMWCVFGPAALVSFGLWSVFTLAQWCTADSRPAHWGQYAAVLNRLQGVLRDARLDVAGFPVAAPGGGAAAGPGLSVPANHGPGMMENDAPSTAEVAETAQAQQQQQPQPAAHQQHLRAPQHRGRQGGGQRGPGRGTQLSQHGRHQHPQQMGHGRHQNHNQQHSNVHQCQNQQQQLQQQQQLLPDTALQLCQAHLELLRWELLQQMEGMEAYVLERRGPADTAAGQVAFPKAKEIMASVMRRYRRRLGAGPPGGVTVAGHVGAAARTRGGAFTSTPTSTGSSVAAGASGAAAEPGTIPRGVPVAAAVDDAPAGAPPAAAGLAVAAPTAVVVAGAPARRAASLPDSAGASYARHAR